jgi:hypothetical protein
MDRRQLQEYLEHEEAKTITGWDFSSLDGRMVSCGLPWDYREIVKRYLKPRIRCSTWVRAAGKSC